VEPSGWLGHGRLPKRLGITLHNHLAGREAGSDQRWTTIISLALLRLRDGRSRNLPLRPEAGQQARLAAACVGYVRWNYSFMPAIAALRCQSNKADRSSRARDDGVVGADL
jgi:hypothetical protein